MNVEIMLDSRANRVIKYNNYLFISVTLEEDIKNNRMYIIDLNNNLTDSNNKCFKYELENYCPYQNRLKWSLNDILCDHECVYEMLDYHELFNKKILELGESFIIEVMLNLDIKFQICLINYFKDEGEYYGIRDDGFTVVLKNKSIKHLNVVLNKNILINYCDNKELQELLELPQNILKELGEKLKQYNKEDSSELIHIVGKKVFKSYIKTDIVDFNSFYYSCEERFKELYQNNRHHLEHADYIKIRDNELFQYHFASEYHKC